MTSGHARSAATIRDGILSGAHKADAVVRATLQRLAELEPLNCILATDEGAIRDAAAVEARRGDSVPGVLLGVPVAVKDNIATLRMPTTCGSRMLSGYVSPYEATVVTRLRAAGAIVVAKTNMDEFAMGSSNEYSAFGPARNPHDEGRVPGGSSGGSAAAVAAGAVPIALGSDTGGSVRQPASFCGIVGVKPTYGRVSRHGLVAFASSLDQIGVLGAHVHDTALALGAIAGHDPLDSTSSTTAVPTYTDARNESLDGVVIGRPKEYFPDDLDPLVLRLCDRALDALRSLGAVIREVSLPTTELAVPTYYILAPAEASSNLARFDGVRYGFRASERALRAMYETTRAEGFGTEVTRRVILGTYVLSAGYYEAYYKKAQQVRTLIAEDFHAAFTSGVDLLFTPTTPTPAFPIGQKSTDPYAMYLSDIFTVTANLAGLPAMSLPIGRVGTLPIGGQFIAPHFHESQMFSAAYALEQSLGEAAHR